MRERDQELSKYTISTLHTFSASDRSLSVCLVYGQNNLLIKFASDIWMTDGNAQNINDLLYKQLT